jgi:hypothetical protein
VRLRSLALLTCGSLVVHELRYAVSYGDHFHEVLASQGHDYLRWLQALGGLFAILALVRLGAQLLRAWRGHVPEPKHASFAGLWLRFSAALAVIYSVQEGLEGQFASGHPAGPAGIFGHGGWTALLLAAAVGAVIALVLRGADMVVAALVQGARATAPRPLCRCAIPRREFFPILDAIALHRAGRGPPLTS